MIRLIEGYLYMIGLIESSPIVSSIIANLIFDLYKIQQKTRKKTSFYNRSELFNSTIAPYLINTVLPKKNPEIASKLKKIKIQDDSFLTLPYIQLYEKDSIKLSRNLLTESRTNIKDDKFISWLKNDLEKTIENKPTFAIGGIDASQTIILCISDYESSISTSDKHYYNLIRYFPIKAKRGEYFSYRNNSYTRKWISSLNKLILKKSFNHYHASIGCSVLTVLKSSDKQYKYLISESSKKKGSASIERHVIPSSMFQPVSNTFEEQQREVDFKINILREYGEEILGMKELEDVEIADTLFNYIDKNPLLKRLQKQLSTGEAKLIQTGMCLDIFSPDFS